MDVSFIDVQVMLGNTLKLVGDHVNDYYHYHSDNGYIDTQIFNIIIKILF